ncbi:hypothetical protein CY34DRAFT_752312 [Suillus luteus UH-Slu-Lm8-n1]|uniref:Uncharacterized protein n=1 Tax=Suillus luteus UH-Slu-Lm8-n1 TaxID=930992 RepID=A0A0C9Z5R3_9AGAM|nr:hypothetical protein CY34DRAFT_752312 [Suillus luteus UH-Slu-Lm8-n1]
MGLCLQICALGACVLVDMHPQMSERGLVCPQRRPRYPYSEFDVSHLLIVISKLDEKLAALQGDHVRPKQEYENLQSEGTRICRLEAHLIYYMTSYIAPSHIVLVNQCPLPSLVRIDGRYHHMVQWGLCSPVIFPFLGTPFQVRYFFQVDFLIPTISISDGAVNSSGHA